MKYILDEEGKIRVVGFFDEYCNHGVPLDESCKECESEAETMGIDENSIGLAYDRSTGFK